MANWSFPSVSFVCRSRTPLKPHVFMIMTITMMTVESKMTIIMTVKIIRIMRILKTLIVMVIVVVKVYEIKWENGRRHEERGGVGSPGGV